MATLNSSIYGLLGGSSSGAFDASPTYFAVALSDSKDGVVTIQIDDETYMDIFLEEDEVEVSPIEGEENGYDTYLEETEDTDYSDDEDVDSDEDNDFSSNEIDEEG